MSELLYRTEDIRLEEVLGLFVESSEDRAALNALKSATPTIIVGSRGVGKSFLLRVAEVELGQELSNRQVFPVYVSFSRSSLLQTADPAQFLNWTLSRLSSRVVRALTQAGYIGGMPRSVSILSGGAPSLHLLGSGEETTRIEEIATAYEESWKSPGGIVDHTGLPTVEAFRDAIEDICSACGFRRMAFLFDEAAHVFLPQQQRDFFTLFRDLRSPHITCNAAVYPGVTAYGDAFQPAHDATFIDVNRDILADDYVQNMREIVERQADSTLLSNIARNGQNFALLAYAASGNPRILLKTVGLTPRMSSSEINEVIREYYRTEIWAEHSTLCEKYPGHRDVIDWGRKFIEEDVLPELKKKNDEYLSSDRNSTCFFWMSRDAPQIVYEALRVLHYTGIVSENSVGIKASRSEIGTRYAVNLGCLFALEPTPTASAFAVAKSLTPKRMTEYGSGHSAYGPLVTSVPAYQETNGAELLRVQMEKPSEVLDITLWQKDKLRELNLLTVGAVLGASETNLKEARYVGDKRARSMRNAAIAAVFEYLSG
jgi:hypothetical protein